MSAVQLKPIAKLLGIENERMRRGKDPIDFLIGIDHAQMHTGQIKPAGVLVARETPLRIGMGGVWKLFRKLSSSKSHIVCQVRYAHDFWTTETMGVEVKPRI